MKGALLTLLGILLGLYVAWWISSLTHLFYRDHARTFDDLVDGTFAGFVVGALVMCTLLGWAG